MKTGICSAIAAAALLALAGNVSADESTQLSDAQMDGVTASGIAIAQAAADAVADLLSETAASTDTFVENSVLATSEAESTGLAASVSFPAASMSKSKTAAALP